MKKPARPPAKSVRPSALQAESLRQTRREHAAETAEDYVEAIADLTAAQGEACVVDLSRRLGVTHVTVNRTLARLQREGYVSVQPYRAIFLTPAGRRLAPECLRSLGISEKTAEIDAEGIEHHVSPETLAALAKHTGK